MPDYDGGFKIAARASGRQLCELAGLHCQGWEPIGDTVQTTERLADRAFRARVDRERFVVYLEAYTRWTGSVPWSVLAKSALLSERERLPTASQVFILLPRGYRQQHGQFRLEVAGEPTQQVWFREVCLWQQTPEPWWAQAPGLMALYPLTRHGKPRREAVTYPAQRISERVTDRYTRADLLTTLSIFGKLAYPELNVLDLIGREQMKESKFFEEVMHEGAVAQVRQDILDALEERFGHQAADQSRELLQGITEKDRLRDLHRLAIRCPRFEDFEQALASARPVRRRRGSR